MKPANFALLPLIVLALALFAGCASPSEPPGTAPLSPGQAVYPGDPVLGTWKWMSTGPNTGIDVAYTFSDDGRFTRVDKHDSASDTYQGTWSKVDSGNYALAYSGTNPGFDSENLYYSNQTGYLRNDSNDFFSREK